MTSSPFTSAPASSVRLLLFRQLERLSDWRLARASTAADPADTPQVKAERSLWLFVSTIGELNAVEPFVQPLLSDLGHPPLTLISDRETYDDAYAARYPEAHRAVLDGSTRAATALARKRPPLMLMLAEIPCLLHDAPCRFSYATLRAARDAGAPVVAVNGWLYGYRPPSRLDRIEQLLFGRDYVRGFDLMMVQSDAVRTRLLQCGADAERVVVTGNLKFDALQAPAAAVSPLHAALRQRASEPDGVVVVAGSVTETADQRALLRAFAALQSARPRAQLVLAPRHPENAPRMQALLAMLTEAGLEVRLRSHHRDAISACSADVLVLDTMGELAGCYAAATLAFVGTDHNVLEPLKYGKPVFVFDGWEPSYPSYPVFDQLRRLKTLHVVTDPAQLGQAWLDALPQRGVPVPPDDTFELLRRAEGATLRCRQAMRAAFPQLCIAAR